MEETLYEIICWIVFLVVAIVMIYSARVNKTTGFSDEYYRRMEEQERENEEVVAVNKRPLTASEKHYAKSAIDYYQYCIKMGREISVNAQLQNYFVDLLAFGIEDNGVTLQQIIQTAPRIYNSEAFDEDMAKARFIDENTFTVFRKNEWVSTGYGTSNTRSSYYLFNPETMTCDKPIDVNGIMENDYDLYEMLNIQSSNIDPNERPWMKYMQYRNRHANELEEAS